MIDRGCRFCGGQNTFTNVEGPSGALRLLKAWVECEDCEARGPVTTDTDEESVRYRAEIYWNQGSKPSYIKES